MYTTKTVARISVRSCAKVMAGIQGAIGFVLGIIFTLLALLGGATMGAGFAGLGLIFGIGAIIFLPIFYGVIGFITGGIIAYVYNKTVRWTGGLKVDVTGGVMDERRPDRPTLEGANK
jgi:hypothetical protein